MLKVVGATFILIGTCVGAGLLALPVSVSPAGFINSFFLLVLMWWIALMGALYILEATQWFPSGVNMISMCRKTMGKYGESIAWLAFLVLCYSLLCAYISGGSDIFQMLINLAACNFFVLNRSIVSLLFVLIIGYIVFKGIQSLDIVNRFFMIAKFAVLFILFFLLVTHVKIDNTTSGSGRYLLASISVVITSFGYSIVVPSLMDYFNGNIKLVKRIIIAGSLISLIFYILWTFAILGTLPFAGNYGLEEVLDSGDVTSSLAISIKQFLNIEVITVLSRVFISICMITSLLGVSISLFDFIADGFRIKKNIIGKIKISALTFVIPFTIVLLYPSIFMMALSYAGIIVCILGVLLPCFIVYRGRYKMKMTGNYRVFGGKLLIFTMIIIGFYLAITCTLNSLNIITY